MELADDIAPMRRSNVHEPGTLSAGVFQKRVGLTPMAKLQTLLTEDAIQRLFDDTAFLLHQRIAQWRGEPLAYGFGIVC